MYGCARDIHMVRGVHHAAWCPSVPVPSTLVGLSVLLKEKPHELPRGLTVGSAGSGRAEGRGSVTRCGSGGNTVQETPDGVSNGPRHHGLTHFFYFLSLSTLFFFTFFFFGETVVDLQKSCKAVWIPRALSWPDGGSLSLFHT